MTDQGLAKHLEGIRSASGLSLDEVASRSGVSRATLSRIERAETSPTASVLGKLCSVYNVSMSRLLMAVEADAPRHTHLSSVNKWQDPESGFARFAISPPAENYAVEVTLGILPAGADLSYDAPPVEGLEQHIVLLEGGLDLSFNDDHYLLAPMDCLALKLHGPSRFKNPGLRDAKYLVINRRTP